MPALYRMPVFYLAVMVLTAAIGLGAWVRPRGASRTSPELSAGASAQAPPPAVPVDTPPPAAKLGTAADGILRTPDGLLRKVIIKDPNLVCRDRPTGGEPVGPPLDAFAIRFLYGVSPPNDPAMFQIGPREGPAQGWVPAASVLEWDTRLMARPTPRAGRPALVIYREEQCLRDALLNRSCPRHQGRCPTEGEEDQRASSAESTPLGMPILRSRAVKEPDGSSRTLFEIASLVRDPAPSPPPPKEPPPDLLRALRRLEIAFVIDTTESMQATIDAARRLAAQLVAETSKSRSDVTLRLALVEYRDDSPVFGFKARIVTPFTDPAGFRAALFRIEAAERGDGSVEEDMLDGVAMALPRAPGERPGTPHLNWPEGPHANLATRMLVLLGDAPDHAHDLARADALAALARDSKINIATLALNRPASLSRAEEIRYIAQWKALAEGSFRPREKKSGFTLVGDAAIYRLDQTDKLVPNLKSLINDRRKHALDLAALAAAEVEGRLTEYVRREGLTLDQVAPVLADLHRGEASDQAEPRPDPRFQGRRAPSVRRGWIAERRGGVPQFTVEVLMSRDELDTLIDELTQLQQAARGTARDLADRIRFGTTAATGETEFRAADRGAKTFTVHLRRRRGLPPARPDSLLNRTQADLLQADDTDRAARDARLGASLSELIRRRNAPVWNNPRRTIDSMASVPYSLIDF
ncbi:MAG: VWA domain-containing protein [Planctomycetaceae bacterium]|nr:VWA domain-containing protein [Planctomycetaceae bacterium]